MTGYRYELKIDSDTTAEELIEYTEKQIKNPIEIDNVKIYNLSSHKVDEDALENAVQHKLKQKRYVIPMQVKSANIFIYSILPEQIGGSDILIYREDEGKYYAYKNFREALPIEKTQSIKQNLANIIYENK